MSRKKSRTDRPTRSVRRLLTPIEEFLRTEAFGGVLLIATAVVALLWANSPWADAYEALRKFPIAVTFGDFTLVEPFAYWVNDLLMAIFFFLVGLEIKRELLVGELAGWRKAALPVAAAVGGMVVPAAIYLAFTFGTPQAVGWGVPMATDIAFAVGVLALLGARVPVALKVFLLALAIIDDLGAVLVIALFYTGELNSGYLALAAATWVVAFAYGGFGGGRAAVFAAIGLVLWFFTFESGVHATIAGVALAFTVPIARNVDRGTLVRELGLRPAGGFEQVEMSIGHAADVLIAARSPLHRFEHALAPYVAYLIMPLFALLNAGIAFGGEGGGSLFSTVMVGAFLGLLLGKPLGILGACWLAQATGIARLPEGVPLTALLGVGFLAGIGFTMALFIGALAFGDGPVLDQAKLGVLLASLLAALAGLAVLNRSLPGNGGGTRGAAGG